MNCRRVVKLLSVVGGLALVGLFVGMLVLVLYIHHGFSARDEPSWLERKLARAMRLWAVPRRANQLTNPVATTPNVLGEARAHWADHCAGCHANDGSGNTTVGRHLYPKAPDMRSSATQQLSDGELYYIIQNGVRLSGMPAWGEAVEDDRDSWALVAFIRHLPKLSSEDLEEMKKLNPKSSHEWNQMQEEEQFLRGDEPQESTTHGHHE